MSMGDTLEEANPSTQDNQRDETPTKHIRVWQATILISTCTLAMVTNIACSVSISIILPVIGQDLRIPVDKLQWLVSAFSLSSGCLLLLLGRLADIFGRKRFFLLGTAWLGVFSLGCGFAQNSTTLYILRGLQGVGPAAFIPAALGIMAEAFPPSRARSIAFATFSAGAPVGGALGIQLGAALVQTTRATWRSPFFLFAGMSLLCVLGGMFAVDHDKPSAEADRRVDWIGAFFVTAGLVLLLFVLGQGQLAPQGWRTPYIIALLILGVLLLSAFLLWEHRLEKSAGRLPPPVMKLSLWTRAKGRFSVIQVIAFWEWAAFLSWYFWAQVYYENFVKLTPIHTALRMLPTTVAGCLCNVFVVFVVSRMDFALLVAFGTTFTALGALLFAIIDPAAPYWAYGFPSPIVSVFGADFIFASGTLFVAKVSLPGEQSAAGGVFQTITQLGTAFGLAITTIVFNAVGGSNTGTDSPLKAYKAAQWTCFGMAVLCTILAVAFLRGVGPVGVDERTVGQASNPAEDDDDDNTAIRDATNDEALTTEKKIGPMPKETRTTLRDVGNDNNAGAIPEKRPQDLENR
ncbi:MFS general substrate transporter [Favolaschia claudopus]|uniref:MFS general substrate transporter n=1 Tax=Favolaschia claudopus TaxID=2862362 RepID=A0AAW0DLY4_9AGAR